MIGSGKTTELKGTVVLGLSILMTAPIDGQSVGLSARMFGPAYL
mgnify:CR=1 FL=1